MLTPLQVGWNYRVRHFSVHMSLLMDNKQVTIDKLSTYPLANSCLPPESYFLSIKIFSPVLDVQSVLFDQNFGQKCLDNVP